MDTAAQIGVRPEGRSRRAVLSQPTVARIGRLIKRAAQRRGGGTALPGLVVERIDPSFLARALSTLPAGVVVVTGTNGKTTTTKMVVELLRAGGLTVLTNKTGSNFTRGIIAGLLGDLDQRGRADADIAVFELDEAHAVHFVKQVRPQYSLLLNVMRDQLDRFGEIDYTASLLESVALATGAGVVLNRDDRLVQPIAANLPAAVKVAYFGLGDTLTEVFLSDHDLYGTSEVPHGAPTQLRSTDVTLIGLAGRTATFAFGAQPQPPVEMGVAGIHNCLNAAAALALVRMVLGDRADGPQLLSALQAVRPAFGRGERIDIDGSPLEIVLVKNPAGFRLALKSYAGDEATTLIAINDSYADGRDTSWLWDVDFRPLRPSLRGGAVVSGTRAWDMAVRLQYDKVDVARVEPSLTTALNELLSTTGPKRIYCTYTAMMALRSLLESRFNLAPIE